MSVINETNKFRVASILNIKIYFFSYIAKTMKNWAHLCKEGNSKRSESMYSGYLFFNKL